MVLVGGRIKNDYDDFLGAERMPLRSEDAHPRIAGAVSLPHPKRGLSSIGAQLFAITNYHVYGRDCAR